MIPKPAKFNSKQIFKEVTMKIFIVLGIILAGAGVYFFGKRAYKFSQKSCMGAAGPTIGNGALTFVCIVIAAGLLVALFL